MNQNKWEERAVAKIYNSAAGFYAQWKNMFLFNIIVKLCLYLAVWSDTPALPWVTQMDTVHL